MNCEKCGEPRTVMFTSVDPCRTCKAVDFISANIKAYLTTKFVGKPVNVAVLKEELMRVLSNLYEETYTFNIEWEEE